MRVGLVLLVVSAPGDSAPFNVIYTAAIRGGDEIHARGGRGMQSYSKD